MSAWKVANCNYCPLRYKCRLETRTGCEHLPKRPPLPAPQPTSKLIEAKKMLQEARDMNDTLMVESLERLIAKIEKGEERE